MRRLRAYCVLLALGATVFASGCSIGEGVSAASGSSSIVVLLDTSGSTSEFRDEYRDAFARILGAIEARLAEEPVPTVLIVYDIGTASLSDAIVVAELNIKPEKPESNTALMEKVAAKKTVEKARSGMEQTQRLFDEALTRETPGSDLFGGLELAAQRLTSDDASKRTVLVLTDAKGKNAHVNMARTDYDTDDVLEAMAQDDLIPSLDGVRLVFIGPEAEGDDTQWRKNRGFWKEYAARAGSEWSDSDYVRRLTDAQLSSLF